MNELTKELNQITKELVQLSNKVDDVEAFLENCDALLNFEDYEDTMKEHFDKIRANLFIALTKNIAHILSDFSNIKSILSAEVKEETSFKKED